MRERIVTTCVYILVLLMISTTAFLFGLLATQIKKEVIVYKEAPLKSDQAVCSPKIVEKIVYKIKDRIVYKTKEIIPERYRTTFYLNAVSEKEKIVYLNTPEKMHFGVSLVGAATDSGAGASYGYYGIGFKVRYTNYYGQIEHMINHSSLFSLGYEFDL